MDEERKRQEREQIMERFGIDETKRQRMREFDLKAYDIAKQVADFAETNLEARDLIKRVECLFSWYYHQQKPEIFPYPVDGACRKIEMPGADAPGIKE